MRFYFDIDDDLFTDEYGVDFQETIKNGVIDSVAGMVYNHETDANAWTSAIHEKINQLIKTHSKEICASVIEKVTDHVIKMKIIKENMPKASEFAALNKENIAYFEEMIDKAIAKRFRGK